jgi:hypothetical protein
MIKFSRKLKKETLSPVCTIKVILRENNFKFQCHYTEVTQLQLAKCELWKVLPLGKLS